METVENKESEQPKQATPNGENLDGKPETQSQTPDIETIKAQIREEAQAEAWKKYQGIQRTLTEKDRRLKELEAHAQSSPPVNDDTTIMELLLSERKARATELGESDPAIARLEAELQLRKTQQKQKQQLQYQQTVIKQWEDTLKSRIKESGLSEDDERLEDVWDAFDDAKMDGIFSKPERRLNKILSKIKPIEPAKKEGKKETDEERIERLANEKLRKIMEEKGLLNMSTNTPSSGAEKLENLSPKERMAKRDELIRKGKTK
jgi:hypothetical protein